MRWWNDGKLSRRLSFCGLRLLQLEESHRMLLVTWLGPPGLVILSVATEGSGPAGKDLSCVMNRGCTQARDSLWKNLL